MEVDASMSGCRTQFTQAGVNKFESYTDDKPGERIFKSGREGFVGWLGLGGSVMQWHPVTTSASVTPAHSSLGGTSQTTGAGSYRRRP